MVIHIGVQSIYYMNVPTYVCMRQTVLLLEQETNVTKRVVNKNSLSIYDFVLFLYNLRISCRMFLLCT